MTVCPTSFKRSHLLDYRIMTIERYRLCCHNDHYGARFKSAKSANAFKLSESTRISKVVFQQESISLEQIVLETKRGLVFELVFISSDVNI